jgi:hypothetical protein
MPLFQGFYSFLEIKIWSFILVMNLRPIFQLEVPQKGIMNGQTLEKNVIIFLYSLIFLLIK